MTSFDELCRLVTQHIQRRRGVDARIEYDTKSEMIRISSSDMTPLSRARGSMAAILELTYGMAEHHPYWSMLYRSAEAMDTILDRWDGELTDKELDEIIWCAEMMRDACLKLKDPRLAES